MSRLIDADKLYQCIDDKKYSTDKYAEVEDILDIIKEQKSVPAIPIERIKKLRKEIDHSLDYYYAHSRIAPYTAIQDVLERIDKMLREVKE